MANLLADLVTAALAGNDLSQKVASQATTTPADPSEEFFADLDLLGIKTASEEEPPKEEEDKDKKDSKKEASDYLETAAHGIKCAEALENAAAVLQKLAQAEAPQVTESMHEHTGVSTPPAQTPGGSAMAFQAGAKGGQTGKLPTDCHEAPKSAEKIAGDTAATERLLRTKQAEYEIYLTMGNKQAADEVQSQVAELKAKLASHAGALPTSSGGEGSHVPDNAGMQSLTKSQARDKNTREAKAAFGVAPKKDNAVAAHVGRTDGLKLSSLASMLGKGDMALQAVGGKALDLGSKATKSVAGAAENRLFNGKPLTGVRGKALEGAAVHGYNASKGLATASGSEAGRRVAGAAALGTGALAAGSMGKKKEAATEREGFDKRTRAGGAIVGALGGGSAGALIGDTLKHHGKVKNRHAALLGAGAGAALGAAHGHGKAKKLQRWADIRESTSKTKED